MKELRAGPAMQVEGVTLIPVEWVTISAQSEAGHSWLQASKEVAAVLICEADKLYLLDVNGESLPVEEWLARVDGLEAGLRACRPD